MVRVSIVLLCAAISSLSWAGKDPTAPLGQVAKAPRARAAVSQPAPLPALDSIVCRSSQAQCTAVLDSHVASEGDTVSGYRIKKITEQHVMLSKSGKQWKLQMFPLDVKE